MCGLFTVNYSTASLCKLFLNIIPPTRWMMISLQAFSCCSFQSPIYSPTLRWSCTIKCPHTVFHVPTRKHVYGLSSRTTRKYVRKLARQTPFKCPRKYASWKTCLLQFLQVCIQLGDLLHHFFFDAPFLFCDFLPCKLRQKAISAGSDSN